MERWHLWRPGGIPFRDYDPIGNPCAYRCGSTEMVRILEEKIACLSCSHSPYLIGIGVVRGVKGIRRL